MFITDSTTDQAVQEAAAALGCANEAAIAGKVAALEVLVRIMQDVAGGTHPTVAAMRIWRALLEKRGQLERQLGELLAAQASAAWSNELRRRGSNN